MKCWFCCNTEVFLNGDYNQFFFKYSHIFTTRKGATSHFVTAGKAENALCLHIKDLKKFLLML
jgi:hypothetical protein